MVWKPKASLIRGVLDNTTPGRVIGDLTFVASPPVKLHLEGDFLDDCRGKRLSLQNHWQCPNPTCAHDRSYMLGFATRQTGIVGEITAGLPPVRAIRHPYVEWFSEQNGRVVMEFYRDEVLLDGQALPKCNVPPRQTTLPKWMCIIS